jgi:CheY-like chemotaxis protein
VEAIAGSARRAAELTRQLLTFSRRTPQEEMEPVDVNDLIREIVYLLDRTIDKSIAIETRLEARAYTVEGNSGQLHQALLNLCLNARDAMPRGGTLQIRTGTSAAPPHGRGRAERLLIRVSDTGVGMAQAVRDRLFEPFFTTKEKGRGLGLAMVYGIVHGHGGEITVQSEPGAGSAFEIGLPLSRRTAKTPASSKKPPRRGSETVLVVDDESTVRSVLRRILERDGYTVVLAEDGLDGVEKYRQRPDGVSLVILDMAMPRMNGSEAYEVLTAINPKLKVLISSGYSEEGRAAELIRKGAKGFLRKPYTSETVLAMVREILDA